MSEEKTEAKDKASSSETALVSWTKGLTLATGALVLVTGIIGAWTIVDTRTNTEKSLQLTQQALLASTRAWLNPFDMTAPASPVAGQDFDFQLHYENSGHEPANGALAFSYLVAPNDSTGLALASTTAAQKETQCMKDNDDVGSIIAYPGRSKTYYWAIGADNVTKQVATGEAHVYVMGCFVYSTGQQPHHSAFCFDFLMPRDLQKDGSVDPNFCEFGSASD